MQRTKKKTTQIEYHTKIGISLLYVIDFNCWNDSKVIAFIYFLQQQLSLATNKREPGKHTHGTKHWN